MILKIKFININIKINHFYKESIYLLLIPYLIYLLFDNFNNNMVSLFEIYKILDKEHLKDFICVVSLELLI